MFGEEEIGTGDPGVRQTRAAVAFLDIVGYSALMGADEAETFRRWKVLKEDYVIPELRGQLETS